MADGLTDKQRETLEAICAYIEANGHPPVTQELCKLLHLASTSSVHARLKALEEKGFIKRAPTKRRTLQVLRDHRTGAPLGPPASQPVYVPVVQQLIGAGSAVSADGDAEAVEASLPMPPEVVGSGQLFMLVVRGDSMVDAGVRDGDYVVVRRQAEARSGEMVAALVDSTPPELTVKFLELDGDRVQRLLPANQNVRPIDGARVLAIRGKVVALLRRVEQPVATSAKVPPVGPS
jgi:repressor LexA